MRWSIFNWSAFSERAFFLLLLLVLILLGDGKQMVGDVIASGGILSIFFIRRMNGQESNDIPSPLTAAWGAFLLYLVARSISSDSVAYSFSSVARWVMAYLVFILFSSQKQRKLDEMRGDFFAPLLIGFSVLVVLLSLAATIWDGWGRLLPGMNLLYPAFGHNHLANMLIFIFPLVLARLAQKKQAGNVLLVIFFGLTLVFSFARGAWLLALGYMGYFFFTSRQFSKRTKLVGIVGFLTVGVLVVSFVFFPTSFPKELTGHPFVQRQITKDTILANRLPYWKQAALAIQERPLFGTGPGTFYLLSKRFQERPDSYSWYAHSFPLELTAEIGLIGVVMVIGIIGYLLYYSARGPLFYGIILTLAYSLYEINLNFLVVWLLLWMAFGLQFRHDRAGVMPKRVQAPMLYASLSFLVLFYGLSVGAEILQAVTRGGMWLQPFSVRQTGLFLDLPTKNAPLSAAQINLVRWFHQKDPEIMFALGKSIQQTDFVRAAHYYQAALTMDPHNLSYIEDYLSLLSEHPDEVAPDTTKALAVPLYYAAIEKYAEPVDFEVRRISMEYSADKTFAQAARETIFFGGHFAEAKLYYAWAMRLRESQPDDAKKLLVFATRLAPMWSYFHLELASHAYYVENEMSSAKEALDGCLNEDFAKDHCVDFAPETLPRPGSFRKEILAIP